jgi:hypothetical protein
MTTNAIDPQTGLTENSSLDDRACALAMAICVHVEQPNTWLGAYHELEELSEGEEPQSFVLSPWLEDKTWDEVFNAVSCEVDTIKPQLEAAFAMGVKSAQSN